MLGVAALPLVRPVKAPPFPKPENAAGGDVVKEKPLKPLKVAPVSVWKRGGREEGVATGPVPAQRHGLTSAGGFLRLAFLIVRFFNTSLLATEKVPACQATTGRSA